jgi:hypothetical protein
LRNPATDFALTYRGPVRAIAMKEREIFIAALQRDDPKDRRAYLEEACGADAGLRDRVQALLGAFDRAGSFLLESAANLGATGAFGISRNLDDPGRPASSSTACFPENSQHCGLR